jgi:hypothetical protein
LEQSRFLLIGVVLIISGGFINCRRFC